MSKVAIKVENLGKRYLINHQKENGSNSFRDVIMSKSKKIITSLNPFHQNKNDSAQSTEEFWALKEVNFEINQGDKVGIIGRNGAGKSTLLKVLSRITEPTSGKIHINGRIASLLEVGTGFHPELTGRENIYLNGAILGMSRLEIKSKFDEIVAFSEVEKFLDTPVKRYSSGMYVRLAFSVAAHLEPEILIVDEVLAVGDINFQKKCLGKMGEVSKEGRTVIFVSHNMNAIEQLCNHAILMDHGQLVAHSSDVRSVIHQYLSYGSDDTKRSEWVNTDNSYQDEHFKATRFALENSQGIVVTDAEKNDEEITVVIEGNVEQPHRALCIGYTLYDDENNLLYWSYSTDQSEDKWPEIEKGKNVFVSKLPQHLLNEGTYRLELLISLHYIKWINEPQKTSPSIYFTIQGGLSDSPYWMSKRPGVLAPLLAWEKDSR